MAWTESDDARLEALWTHTPVISTNEIGRLMDRSPDACIGRARRINLPQRRKGSAGPPAWQSVQGKEQPAPVVLPVIATPLPRLSPPSVIPSAATCQWVTHEKPYRFCGAPSARGTSWCPEHYRVVFVRRSELA